MNDFEKIQSLLVIGKLTGWKSYRNQETSLCLYNIFNIISIEKDYLDRWVVYKSDHMGESSREEEFETIDEAVTLFLEWL